MVSADHFGRNLIDRVFSLANGQLRLLRLIRRVRKQGVAEGVPDGELQRILVLARRAHRIALQLTHYEEVRGILSSWRWMHRWLALLLGILVAVHVFTAIRFGGVDFGVLSLLGGDK